MKTIDRLIDSITMYRLVVYILGVFVGLGTVFAFLGKMSFSPTELVTSVAVLLATSFAVDKFFSVFLKVPTNAESWLITALIMALVIQPADSLVGVMALVTAAAAASASKFIIGWRKRHIFNPAAFGAAVVSLSGLLTTTWWIGSSLFWPVTLLLGLAVVRKVRRGWLFVAFVAVALGVQLLLFTLSGQPLAEGMRGALVASPLLFLATIMLTEPATMPPRRTEQLVFAGLAAVLYVTAFDVGTLTIYPEVALLLANIYAFAVAPKFRVQLRLQQIQKVSDSVYSYVFKPDQKFAFIPGQYMEWTLPRVAYDSRGNRRTLTIASSPTEDTVELGIKYHLPSSAFKSRLQRLQIGDSIYGSQLAGNFTLPPRRDTKLALIAGGIGITPFRSMVRYLVDTQQARDIVMIYLVADPTEVAYGDVFAQAERFGVRFVPVLTNPNAAATNMRRGSLSQELIRELVPDFGERSFYISGPSMMVDAGKRYLRNLGVSRRSIKTDHFSGY